MRPFTINSKGSYWGWFPYMQLQADKQRSKVRHRFKSTSLDLTFISAKGRDQIQMVLEKTNCWNLRMTNGLLSFFLRKIVQICRRIMIWWFVQDWWNVENRGWITGKMIWETDLRRYMTDRELRRDTNLHPEVLGQDVLTDNPQMEGDQNQRVTEEKWISRARWIKKKKKTQSKVLGFKQKKKKRVRIWKDHRWPESRMPIRFPCWTKKKKKKNQRRNGIWAAWGSGRLAKVVCTGVVPEKEGVGGVNGRGQQASEDERVHFEMGT